MKEAHFTREDVDKLLSLPFAEKLNLSVSKILEVFQKTDGKVYVAYSGGGDSGVVLDIVAQAWKASKYANQPLVVCFANTTNEYSGMVDFVKEYVKHIESKHNIVIDLQITKPDHNFKEIVLKYGYPVASKETAVKIHSIRAAMTKNNVSYEQIILHKESTIENEEWLKDRGFNHGQIKYICGMRDGKKDTYNRQIAKKWLPLLRAPFEVSHVCCNYLKKSPMNKMQKQAKGLSVILGERAEESKIRLQAYQMTGCVAFRNNKYRAKPIAFWTHQDILEYYYKTKLPLFKLYGNVQFDSNKNEYYLDGVIDGTGCKLCLFGCGFKNNGIHQLKYIEPNACKWALKDINNGGLGYRQVLDYLDQECGVKVDLGQYDNEEQ